MRHYPSEVHIASLLSLSIMDILGQIIFFFFFVGDCPMYYRIFSGIPGQNPLDASNTIPQVVINKNVSRNYHISFGEKMVSG